MRASGLFHAIGAALLATAAATWGQTWETVDDISPNSAAFGITADPTGNLFAAGYMRDSSNVQWGVIMKSGDSGQSWDSNPATPDVDEPSDAISPPAGGSGTAAAAWFESVASAAVAGTNGIEHHVVAFGKLQPSRATSDDPWRNRWVIRRSRDGGATWQTVDDYQHPVYDLVPVGVNYRSSGAVTVDGSGTIYAAGLAQERTVKTKGKNTTITLVNHWLVRKGVAAPDGTVQWTTSDFAVPTTSYTYQTYNAFPSAVLSVGGNVFVAGGGGSEGASWLVMKSSDAGATWSVADTFRLDSRDASHAWGMAADSAGNLYIAGHGMSVSQNAGWANWIVRKSPPGGTSWTTVDQFRYSGSHGWARSVAVAPNGDVQVTGFGGVRPQHWITRQRSAATGVWTTADDYQHPINPRSYGNAVTVDPAGNVFSAGYAATPPDSDLFTLHDWLVRRKTAP